MSRGLSSAVKALLGAARIPTITLLFEFHTLDLRLTNWPRNITHDGKVYTGAQATADRFAVNVEGLGENLKFEVPSSVVEFVSKNGWAQNHFFSDSFREDTVTITLLYVSGTSHVATGWETTYKCDAEEINADRVRIRLGSLDAVTGSETPRRTTQTEGCQWKFQESNDEGGCPFRWVAGVHAVALKTCDRTYDGPNGCAKHFPDVTDPVTGQTIERPKPYGAFPGSVDHRLVRAT